jgi:hypothetical protein
MKMKSMKSLFFLFVTVISLSFTNSARASSDWWCLVGGGGIYGGGAGPDCPDTVFAAIFAVASAYPLYSDIRHAKQAEQLPAYFKRLRAQEKILQDSLRAGQITEKEAAAIRAGKLEISKVAVTRSGEAGFITAGHVLGLAGIVLTVPLVVADAVRAKKAGQSASASAACDVYDIVSGTVALIPMCHVLTSLGQQGAAISTAMQNNSAFQDGILGDHVDPVTERKRALTVEACQIAYPGNLNCGYYYSHDADPITVADGQPSPSLPTQNQTIKVPSSRSTR